MGRRLPPGEAERRAKERARGLWSGESYEKYDPVKEGYGSAAEWIAAAEAMAAGRGTFKRVDGAKSEKVRDENLVIMGLDKMPDTIDGLKKAFRNACFVYHPDRGGNTKAMQDLLAAYRKLLHFY